MAADGRRRMAERDGFDRRALRELRPTSYKVFRVLMRHVDPAGYAWPSCKLIMAEANIGDAHTLFGALRELETKQFAWRSQLVKVKNGARGVSLYRLGAPIRELPARAQERGYALAGPATTPPTVKNSQYPLLGNHHMQGNHILNSSRGGNSSRRLLNPPLCTAGQLAASAAEEEEIAASLLKELPDEKLEKVRQAVHLTRLLASSPPRSLAYYRRGVPDVLANFRSKLTHWATLQAVEILERVGRDPGWFADAADELKARLAGEGFAYDGDLIGEALRRGEERLRARAEVGVGRLRG